MHLLVPIDGYMLRRRWILWPAVVALMCSVRAGDWPQWRGPRGDGVADDARPPLTWSETENVRWKVKTPGFGTASPIVLGQRVYILTAVAKGSPAAPSAASAPPPPAPPASAPAGAGAPAEGGGRPPGGRGGRGGGSGGGAGGGGFGGGPPPTEPVAFQVMAFDRANGQVVWNRTVTEEVPHEGHHRDHGFASASPVTDGEVLIASFGSRGIYGLDLAGKVLWEKRLGKMRTRNGFGEGASPALHKDTVVVGWDHEGDDDFVVALDRRTGKELWRTPRSEPTTWSTPVVVERPGRTEVILSATQRIRSYELATGKLLWECGGMTGNVIPTPVVDADTAYLISGFRGAALFAIPLGKNGDLTDGSSFRWRHARGTPYVPSPLLYGGALYFGSGNDATVSRFDAATGKADYETQRVEGVFGLYASLVGAAGRVYVVGRDGKAAVLEHGARFRVLAVNKLDDKIDASPAISGADLFLRGHQHLYCLAER